jgi:adenylosuccinate synthase
MPASVVVGLQWGDEGKGKTTDFLAEQVSMVVRYQGGDNAGHTVVVEGNEVLKLHLVPSGVLYPHITSVIGNGVVVNPETLIGELDMLAARGIDVSRVRVSRSAHVIMPYHVALDRGNESRLAGARVGTTGRGIGPTYADKMNRLGVRIQDLFDESILRQKVEAALSFKNQVLTKIYNRNAIKPDDVIAELLSYVDRLRPLVADTALELSQAIDAGKVVLCEGGQATLLDVDHGTYPFVTSSNATSGGACTGAGIPPTRIDRVVAVLKAFTSRVGEGPFPTELHDKIGDYLREVGQEYGTTTGRPRRIGWLDLVIGRYAQRINGVTDFVLTKLDNYDGLEEIPVCLAYDVNGVRHEEMPLTQSDFHHAVPIYETLPGWKQDISGARTFAELPENARRFVEFVEDRIRARISVVGVGPGRDEVIERHSVLSGT